jgi:hypothetical protein
MMAVVSRLGAQFHFVSRGAALRNASLRELAIAIATVFSGPDESL